MTARNAMQRLAEDGLIAREPGRGSFVAAAAGTPAGEPADDLHPARCVASGRVPSSRVLTRVIRPSTASEADAPGHRARRSRSCTSGGCAWPTTQPIALETDRPDRRTVRTP